MLFLLSYLSILWCTVDLGTECLVLSDLLDGFMNLGVSVIGVIANSVGLVQVVFEDSLSVLCSVRIVEL